MEGVEQCDDGNQISTDSCLNNCTFARCGDSFVYQGIEQCDDGNLNNGDGCSSICAIEPRPGVCGDGVVAGAEQCDDGNQNNTDACLNNCSFARCSDGFIYQGIEQCDDRNLDNGDGCSSICAIEPRPNVCGDAMVAGAEQCDDGNQNNTDACLNNCSFARCGDGILYQGVEQCDDGNLNNGDGCSSMCSTEVLACVDDIHEPDNETFLANFFVDDVTLATICPNDFDLFQVTVCPRGTVNVNLSFTHANGDIDTVLLDQDGVTELTASRGVTDQETLTYVNSGSVEKTYYIKVYAVGDATNDYTISSFSVCNDNLEPNNNNAAATDVSDGDSFQNLILASGDEDWFGIFACSPSGSVSISFDHSQGDLEMTLYESNGSTVLDSSTSSSNSESVSVSSSTGFFFVKVYGFNGASNFYNINFNVNSTCQ